MKKSDSEKNTPARRSSLTWGRLTLLSVLVAVAAIWLNVQQDTYVGRIFQDIFGPPSLRPRADWHRLKEVGERHRLHVRVLRDDYGVPHIYGKSDADTAFGLAYAHSEDDFDTIQKQLLAAHGQLGNVMGIMGAKIDFFSHWTRAFERVQARYYDEFDDDFRDLLQAYADGLNYYAAMHRSEVLLETVFPVTGMDVIAGSVLITPLFFGMDKVIQRLMEGPAFTPADMAGKGERTHHHEERDIMRPPESGSSYMHTEHAGSNSFAVNGRRSSDGQTMLNINSHQPFEGPVSWYEAHLHSEQGWDIHGGVFPGAPIVLHGHTNNLGWAHTVNSPDLIDIFRLETNPHDSLEYKYDGRWRRMERRMAPLRVKFGPLYWTVHKEVLWTEYGPAMRDPNNAEVVHAVWFAGLDHISSLQQWYRMNKATNLAEFKKAMSAQALSMFNTVYADREGNIYYLYSALLPHRIAEDVPDRNGVLNGSSSQIRWQQYLPFEKLPQVLNPPSGFVQNCNNNPFITTTGEGNPDRNAYKGYSGIEQQFVTGRSLRALELLSADESITEEEFVRYKYDLTYGPKSSMAEYQKMVTNGSIPIPDDLKNDAVLKEAIAAIGRWNLQTDMMNKQAALAVLSWTQYLWLVMNFGDWRQAVYKDPTVLLRTLARSAHVLKKEYGSVEVPWGAVNRHVRGNKDVPIGGGPDILRCMISVNPLEPFNPQPRGKALVGDTLIYIVVWDKNGTVHSRSVHQYGAATSRPKSKHYNDQVQLFADMGLKDVYLTEEEVRKHLEVEYHPGDPVALL
jgi:penicillin amidase/acyl-homoserine-lactone acylase